LVSPTYVASAIVAAIAWSEVEVAT
jgi:hypothetical protein